MSRKPVEQLASALRDCVEPPGRAERTARLADALQRCLDEAVRKGAREAAKEVEDRLIPRLDRQDDTLRLMWKQMKGNGSLPIDRD